MSSENVKCAYLVGPYALNMSCLKFIQSMFGVDLYLIS